MRSRFAFALISIFALGCPSTSTPDAAAPSGTDASPSDIDATTPPGIDAAMPPVVDAALPGTYACASATCAEGEICVSRRVAGFPTDGSGPAFDDAGTTAESCEPRPAACGAQGDCTRSSCDPACAEAVCMPTAPFFFPDLMVTDDGRRYECVNNQDAV